MTHTTKKRSAFRNGILAVALVLGITLGNIAMATPASAFTAGNIYNNSDHGMWFYSAGPYGRLDGPLNWVPAKTWSSAVGVVATGVYIGKGYCAQFFKSNGKGGWTLTNQAIGFQRILISSNINNIDRLVTEWQC